jgi:hypothetical protein
MEQPSVVVLLGAQRFEPTLKAATAGLHGDPSQGRTALITAGWQERESEDEDLVAHLGGDTVNLRLHERGEQIFAKDPELRSAHRERQDFLRHAQDAPAPTIAQRTAPPGIHLEESRASVEAIRELDARHLANCARLHAAFELRWNLAKRPSVLRHRKEIAEAVAGCSAIAIAGGHVASLINRLALFGIGALVGGKAVFAWSGGAMAVSERVVLFHDDPPQGPGVSEVLDAGLGLVPGVVALPQPEQRLQLNDRQRVHRMVNRFLPARCLALPSRSHAIWIGGKLTAAEGVIELRLDGENVPLRSAR